MILSVLRRWAKGRDGLNILDVGCGNGLFFDRLAEFGAASGVEIDGTIVDDQGPHRSMIHVGPFDQSFVPDRQFSIILMLDVLEHLDEPAVSLHRAVELLTHDGLILVTVPAFLSLWTAHDDFNEHRTRYTKRTFSKIAREAGMKIDQSRYFFYWTFPAKLLVRLKEFFARGQARPAEVPHPIANRFFLGLSRFEEVLLGKLRIPLGSSLMLIGGKE